MTTASPDVTSSSPDPTGSDEVAPSAIRSRRRSWLAGVRMPPYTGPLLALVALCTFLAANQPFFATTGNILNVLTTNSPLIIVAVGMTVAMISGGFDLSIGAVVAATGMALHLLLDTGLPAGVAVLVAVGIGMVFGAAVNGMLIAGLELNFFVVTLGTMTALAGVVYVVSDGQTFVIREDLIQVIGFGRILGLPTPVVISVVVAVSCGLMLALTPLGRNIHAIGGSKEAARLSGIRVSLLTATVYGVSAGAGAVAGVVQVGLTSAASPTVGTSLALTAGAGVLLGGTSFSGGVGTISGTIVGVLLIATLQNGLGLFGIASYWQQVVTGIVLILAVALDRLHRVGLARRWRRAT